MRRTTPLLVMVVGAAIVFLCGMPRASADPILYGTAYNGNTGLASLYTIDSTSGAATLVGATGFEAVGAIDFDPLNGVLYGAGKDPNSGSLGLITINPTTGLATEVGANGLTFQDISFRKDGTLFGYSSGNIYKLNLTTGAGILLGSVGDRFLTSGNALAFSPDGTLYKADESDLRTIDQTNGGGTVTMGLSYPESNSRANGMAFDLSTGTLWASVKSNTENYLATINVTTGVVTDIGTTVPGLDSLAVSPVPEPSTWTAGLLAASALLYSISRRRAPRVSSPRG